MKGDLILIILMSFMRKMNKKMTWDPASEELKRLPQINPVEFNHRFNELLEKVSIQNRYATRISHANIKNLQELEEARKQLRKIADQKKMDQLKAADSREFVEQMTARVRDSEGELEKVFKEILEAKKEIRQLKNLIADLEGENLSLEKQVLQAKRDRFEEVCQARRELDENLLATQVGAYLVESMATGTALYRFCLSAHKANNFSHFFRQLDLHLEKELRTREKQSAIKLSLEKQSAIKFSVEKQPLQKKYSSNSKVKLASKQLVRADGRILKRYKTEHNQIATSSQLSHSIV